MKKEGIKQKWYRLFPYIAYMELTDLNNIRFYILGSKTGYLFQININQCFIIYNKRHVMSIHGAGDKSASVVSIKDCKVFCYFDTSHMSTPLPVTSAFDTVMDFPV